MRGLALEGGGARGAYHIGVVKALYEEGYVFDGFVGTSIGAINAAVLASGDLDKAMEVWARVSIEQIFNEDEWPLIQLADARNFREDANLLSAARRKAIRRVFDNRGICTEKMKAFLGQYIDEGRIRNSGKDFGFATVSLSERKPRELMKEDVADGQLFDFIMASAALPIFRQNAINESIYIDGAFYNNCPYNLLLDRGYDEVVVVRTNSFGIFRKPRDGRVRCISPADDLGSTLHFSQENSENLLKIGYYDGLRFAKGLQGRKYYVKRDKDKDFGNWLMQLDTDTIAMMADALKLPGYPSRRLLFERIVPILYSHLKLDKNVDYNDFAVALLEMAAKDRGIERFSMYEFGELREQIAQAPRGLGEKKPLLALPATPFSYNREKAAEILLEAVLR